MSEKQFEKRLLRKAFSRSSSRSFSQSSMIGRALFVERGSFFRQRASASFSVAESDTSDQKLQQIVRDESINELINHFVRRRFQSYLINNVKDIALWESIQNDFADFDVET